MNRKKLAIAVVALLAAGLAALGARNVYVALWGLDGGRGAPSTAPSSAPPPVLSAEQQRSIEASLEKASGEATAQAALAGGVDRPWKTEKSMKEFQACMARLEGSPDLVPDASAEARERVCLCVARSMQRSYPAEPPQPKASRGARKVSRTELSAIEECAAAAR